MRGRLLAGPPGPGDRRHRPGGRLADPPPAGSRRRRGLPGARLGAPKRTGPLRGTIERVKVVRGDVRDRDLLERAIGEYEIDTVIHLAAQTIVGIANRNPVSTFESNIQGTWNLLEACRRSPGVRSIVVASSDKAYGDQRTAALRRRRAAGGPASLRRQQVLRRPIAQAYAMTYGLPVAITRCGNFYGGGDLNWNRIVPGTIRSVLRGERPVIRSDGQFVRDYFYVEDGAAAYMLLAEQLHCRPELRGVGLQLLQRNADHGPGPGEPDSARHGVRLWSRDCATRPATKSAIST